MSLRLANNDRGIVLLERVFNISYGNR